jgi:filamentous hemagglutinin
MNNSRIWLMLAGAILLAAVGTHYVESPVQQSAPPQTISVSSSSGALVWSHGPDGPQANAEEHWEKHGGEFPEFRNERDYISAANAFMHHPPPGTLTKHDACGDTLLYQPSTDTFAVMDERGEPRTFFKPDNGYAYWNRQ